jgi:hypothetical protein
LGENEICLLRHAGGFCGELSFEVLHALAQFNEFQFLSPRLYRINGLGGFGVLNALSPRPLFVATMTGEDKARSLSLRREFAV